MALNLILEVKPNYNLLDLLTKPQLLELSKKSPPISSYLISQNDCNLPDDAVLLSDFFGQQVQWRNKFSQKIKSNSNSICIVGNSSRLTVQSLGASIDEHAIVIRFNDYCHDEALREKCGKKINVWVKSPDFIVNNNEFRGGVDWTLISGADSCYTMSNWSGVKLILKQDGRVITPPLDIWATLVESLAAPPSAGLLMIAWVADIVGGKSGISIVGFQSLIDDPHEQYHHRSVKNKAGIRHNWQGEKKLLKVWREQGLKFLD